MIQAPARHELPSNDMSAPPPFPVCCPHCDAQYHVVRMESSANSIPDREVICLSCGGPLLAREGGFILKWILVSPLRRKLRRRC
jgi:hypothetical protein